MRKVILMLFALPLIASCSRSGFSSRSQSSSISQGIVSPLSAPVIVAGNGANVAGTGAASVPSADAVVARIRNGLGGTVSPASGNFAKSYAQVKSNLPKVTDPTKASGFDQVQLLVYGACTDLTTGAVPLMKSAYNVDPAKTIVVNKSDLLAAGIAILDKHLAGLASQSSAAPQVTAALTTLIQTLSNDSTNTSTIAFVSVCTAANTAGITMMGF